MNEKNIKNKNKKLKMVMNMINERKKKQRRLFKFGKRIE